MGNEASMEGEGPAGQPGTAVPATGAPASISAPSDAGQLIKPSNGAPAGGSGAGPGPGINRPPLSDPGPRAEIQSSHGTGDRLASHDTYQPPGEQGQGRVSRKSLQVDVGGSRTGRSPSVSPDRGSVPTSPYSVPQIAPMPSSKLCPVCKTTDLMGPGDNFNTCTQCHCKVCNQCGFNPNPHLTEVQEWLCLNCQMQRALGMDMTTPRSKSQQQIHSPSHPAKPELQSDPSTQTAPQAPTPPQPQPSAQAHPIPVPTKKAGPAGPGRQQAKLPPGAVPLPGMAKAPSQPDLSRSSPAHQPQNPRQDQTRSAGSSPSRQPPPPEQTFGKLFGFGASLLNQASTLISETTQPQQQPPKPTPKPGAPSGPGPGAVRPSGPQPAQQGPRAPAQQQQQPSAPDSSKAKVCCPLCKTNLNIGNKSEQPNYNCCTQCHQQVCNMCGFNPTPHLVEKKEWLCLNCQTQRALSGNLGDMPAPVAQSTGSPQSAAITSQQPPQQRGPSQLSGPPPTGPQQQKKATGPQVSGPVSPVKQAGSACQTKGPGQVSPQTKSSPQPKSTTQPPPQSKGPTQPLAPSKGPHQIKGPNQLNSQNKGSVSSSNQVKSSGQAKGLTQTKGSAQPSAQAKGPSHPTGAKVSSATGKTTANNAKVITTQSKTAPAQSKPTGSTQARKQAQSQEKTKVPPKAPKEDKSSPKKPLSENMTSPKDAKTSEDTQKSRHHEDSNKSSTQSLSDTGYSSDGISSSHGEITGQILEEGIKLSERGASIPSEINMLENSMKNLLDSKILSEQKNRPHSLSVMQDQDYSPDDDAARDESEDDLSCKLRHDYVEDSSESGLSPLPIRQKTHKDLTDEEFMRRQIMEMSADEEELEDHGTQKAKRVHKASGDLNKERRRLTQHSNSFEDDTKAADGPYKTNEEDVVIAGGLRRFKTIELNNTNSYNRDMELSTDHDLREPELEMESLTGSPEERSKGEYSSTLPATTPSYTSGTSPTSVSSMEDDSDSSPSRRARLEEAKQQRKARHRSHGPLLPTIEDSSEEDELREEEELLREQEQMRDLEQQKIRSTARKTKRDKEELRAQRRRERSKTPPSNLSPIEDASPTEELRQAAEMEELHRSSCSEYSPSMDSEVEGFDLIGGKLYKSGNEYNLPTFTSLYSPTEKTSALSTTDKTLKSAEEVYEEMMKKAQLMQRRGQTNNQQQVATHTDNNHLEAGTVLTPGSSPTQVAAPVSFSTTGNDQKISGIRAAQHLSKETQNRMMSQSAKIEGVVGVATTKTQVSQAATTRQTGSTVPSNTRTDSRRTAQVSTDSGASSLTSKVFSLFKSPSPPVSPTTSPLQSPTHMSSVRPAGGTSRQLPPLPGGPTSTSPSHGAQAPQRSISPRLVRQQSSQESPAMMITLGSSTTSPAKPATVNSSTSPLSSPTQGTCKTLYSSQPPLTSSPSSPKMVQGVEKVNVGISTGASIAQSRESMENISLCKISNISGSAVVLGQGQIHASTNVVDLRAPMRPAPIIMTDQGMDLTSLASDTRRYSLGAEQPPGRHTAVQPLIINLNAQEQPCVSLSTPTTVSITVAGSTFTSQPKQPIVYGDPLQNRVDLGQGVGSAVCLTQSKPVVTDPSIPKIDACLENLGIQQQQLQLQQQKLLQQQQLLEQQLQQHQQQSSFARYNLANQVQPLLIKKDLLVNQSTTAQSVVTASAIPRVSPLTSPLVSAAASNEIYGGVALELKNKPTAVNLSTGKPHGMIVQLDETNVSQGSTVTQLVKPVETPSSQVLDLTGQIKPEHQVACCDVVYKLPFAGSCSGSYTQKPTTVSSDKNPTAESPQAAHKYHPPYYNVSQQQQPGPQATQGVSGENKPYQLGRIQPSMSDTNLPSMIDTSHNQNNGQSSFAVDLSNMNETYDAGYLGVGAQYGSYTDLRHQGDLAGPSLPLRRYGSMSNINSEYAYGSRDLTGPQDSNLAQYSATTAREISRMCAALNSGDQFGSRYGPNPELGPYGTGRGGPLSRLNLQQSLASIRANLLYGSDGRPTANGQTLTNLINARQASIRALYPAAMRGVDGMIYSTINTPIASTLPITTQPSSVHRPIPRGIYRPYPTGVTAVPLATLTRLPQMTPRMPLSTQGPYSYPPANQLPTSETPSGGFPDATSLHQETPVYLGKPPTTPTVQAPVSTLSSQQAATTSLQTTIAKQTDRTQHLQGVASFSQAHGQTPSAQTLQAQMQPQHIPAQTEPLSLTQTQHHVQSIGQPSQPLVLTQGQTQVASHGTETSSSKHSDPTDAQKSKDDERLSQQQEHMLQLERERVELEKLRQLRLQEELERDRMELQRHREKEQLLVQREIQELQTIKQQVLQQQQAERETQLIMQREQLAQQRMQLEQIQSLQQQLQQQLEEQKRQKTAAVEAVAAAAEAAAASAAAAAAATSAQGQMQGVVVGGGPPQSFIICDQTGRVIQQDGQSVQFWQDGQVVQAVVTARPIHSSVSEMSLRSTDKQADPKVMKKQNSMPRLRDGSEEESVKKITDSCVQTDDEDGEDRFIARRRRTRRIADCSVQTDEEDQGDWEQQPVRRRRSRVSKHSESSGETKAEGSSKTASTSIAIQTTNDSSCQTETEQLSRVSPAIHITVAETSKVDLLHYIAAPERTHKGESLACQTEPESHSQVVVAPQLSVPTTISPYSTSLHIVGANTADPTSLRLQGVAKFEKRKPDPLEIGYQQQQNDSQSRQPPKSPQVLYSPVSPLSPHRMLETTFASQEKLNKAHVTPQQKTFSAESPPRHQTLPRPIKSVQRSLSDPKPLSPTSEDPAKNRFSPYHQQAVSNSQMTSLQQQNSLMRKVKRTLPSPPPEETPLPIVTPAQMYSSPGMSQRVLPRHVQGVTKTGLLSELKAVEQESSKLRKQQAELEEEEKEIDAKLRYLELGITQRKETMVKEKERRELAYLRCMDDARDYMSDSELSNLRMAGVTGNFDSNGLLTRPSTAPMSQFANDLNAAAQYPSTSTYITYPYSQSQPSTQQPSSGYQQIGFQPPQYPSSSAPQPGTFQPQPPPGPGYQNQGPYSNRMYAQSSYQTDHVMQQHGHQGFHPPGQPTTIQALPYPSHSSYQPGLYQPQAEILTVHQRPRQTSLADLEQKVPTNYEVISNPAVSVATSAPDANYGSIYNNAYGQYRPPEPGLTHTMESPTSAYASDGMYTSNLEQNIPRNYVMIDDISELTKDNPNQPTDALGQPLGGRYRGENGASRGTAYGRAEDEPVDAYGRPTGTGGYHSTTDSRTTPAVSGGSTYYYDDYRHTSRSSSSSHKLAPKNLGPAVVSSKRSKHRKQGMEQKISKFSPIEEARDVESDFASYTMTTSTGGSCTVVSRTKKLQDDVSYGMKKNAYDQQKYYGTEEEDRMYGSGRSRSTGHGIDKISSRDASGHRSKSYERDAMERCQRNSRSGRPSLRNQNSEEESPLSPVGNTVGMGRRSGIPDSHDVRNQYGSSHSLPDVQDHHKKDMPRSHVYKPDDPYLMDDMQCAVSDSEAYHLGQEETDWFEKPREARSDRSKHHGSGSHSSTGRRSKHTYHDYDEPPEEYGPGDEYSQQRHTSSSAQREHRHHGSSSGRHSSSRHTSEDPRSSRSSRTHPKDQTARSDGRGASSLQRRSGGDSRSAQASPRNSSDFSREADPGRHHGTGGRGQKPQGDRTTRRQDPTANGSKQQQPSQSQSGQQRSGGQGSSGRHPGSESLDAPQQAQQQHQQNAHPQQRSQTPPHNQPIPTTTAAGPVQPQQTKPGPEPSGQPGVRQPATTNAKVVTTTSAPTTGMKSSVGIPTAPPTSKITAPPLTGIGSKAVPVGIGSKAGGIGSAAAGQPPPEGENVLTKILQGGAAEQAGKLGDALSGLGKKFTSFW